MNSKKNLKRNLLICLLAGSAVMYTLPLHAATSVIGNNTLPQNGQFVGGSNGNFNYNSNGLELDVHQNGQNAVIKWGSFDVGGSATVNFWGPENHNTLNYVNGGNMSQIYGTINANNNGNIFIVNPAGVQIGNSAQINVGSLYVSNKYLNESKLGDFNGSNINNLIDFSKTANAELMSLGNINAATNVTFDGDRIVLDTERVIFENTNPNIKPTLNIKTTNADSVVLGYDAYDEDSKYNHTVNKEKTFNITKVNINNNGPDNITVTEEAATVKGYMWVEDVKQLQAINTNLNGNYALRNSIDATSTEQNGFISIGSVNDAFKGKFDGIDYNIFGLTIKNGGENTGLFGYTNNATISNVTLVGGSITGSNNVGAIVGNANNTTLTNVVNSAAVSGDSNVGGIVGRATNTTVEDAINTGTIEGNSKNETNVGGLIGEMKDSNTADNYKSQIIGNSYNLGDVSGNGHNVGGLVGSASNSTIGDGTNLVYNRMDVTGAYNVGGIVGNMEGTTVQNAENSGTVTAIGYDDGNYTFHTDYTGNGYSTGGSKTVDVNVANVGGIAGTSSSSTIIDVLNTGDVSSSKVKEQEQEYYAAGNVGGIVGSAVDTNITNATNRENEVRGAHNVGGVAGYFGNSSDDDSSLDYTVTNGINDGGDIMATGARYGNDFVRETIRHDYNAAADSNNDGKYIVGNIGGVIGYMDGNNVYVTNSANRGTVHTLDITDQNNIKDASTAANVGGVVGKIDRGNTITIDSGNVNEAAVSNSYNTGDVRGYTAIGGIVGMMYNGEIAGSYNLGNIMSTRISAGGTIPLNMGGIVGDTTENSSARAYLYDVYNKGQIGDETYTYKGRHVGGIAGRLSGTIEKAYNAGEIYNAAAVTGGIVGYMSAGTINNVFNTGNITVVHNDGADVGVQLGGLVGAANIGRGDTTISNAYNLGVIRAFKGKVDKNTNGVGGVVGTVVSYNGISGESKGKLDIKNVYTTGDLYSENGGVGAVYGSAIANAQDNEIDRDNVVYITRSNTAYDEASTQGAATIDYSDMNDDEAWRSFIANANNQASFSVDLDSTSGLWRVYDGTTPILNAFLPDSEKYFSGESGEKDPMKGISSIQYGTAYDPLLTIIKADGTGDLSYNWKDLGITNAAGIAVYGAGLTLDNFKAYGATGYFGGTIYADGALNINGVKNDIGIGSAADIYGSAVNIITDGKVTIYGDVTATGNTANGATSDTSDVIDVKDKGNITITAGDVDVYGQLTSATEGEATNIAGIGKEYGTINNVGDITNKYDDIVNTGDHYAYTTDKAAENGDITINAGTKLVVGDDGKPILDAEGNKQYVNIGDGNVNLYFGNKEQGLITTGGNLTVTGTGDVYVDSDLDIGGDMTLTSTGADSEVLLTLTNIGKVQADRFTNVIESAINGKDLNSLTAEEIVYAVKKAYPDLAFDEEQAGYIITALKQGNNKVDAVEKLNNDIAVAYMHDFMHSFAKETQNKIALNAASGDAKLTVDMWVENTNGSGQFNFEKYDTTFPGTKDKHTFKEELNNLNFAINGDMGNASESVYVEVSAGEQLKAIQNAGNKALGYNYALMGDINASDVEDYVAIGTGSGNGFTGTFDGRGNRIIGLTVDKVNGQNAANAGIFSTVGEGGVVKDVNIYSGTFTGSENAGAVAGVNKGRIEGIVTFGNTVTVTGKDGKAGGIVGVNNSGGAVYDVESTGSVIAGSSSAVAGGLVGKNNGGLANSFSDSAVTVATGVTLDKDTTALGGVVGINNGNVQYVDSLGVTNGGATNSSNIGGIIGTNNGNMYSGYNESIVSGKDNVGGIIGTNAEGKKVENVVNATGVEGTNNVGGLIGDNRGNVTNGRNNGTITGNKNVGGMVGINGENSTLTNLVNDSSAAITGEQYVGGIAGTNAGTITAQNQSNLINRGSITGQNYVGGVAGENIGTIEYVKNDVNLYVKDDTKTAQYFGGVAGINGRVDATSTTEDETATGTITSATNEGDVVAENAQYVGGIVGWNTSQGKLVGMGNSNEGTVIGGSYVGGVIGKNDAAIGSKDSAQVGITNEGTVIATKGGAGGLIGENNAAITNTVMINRGEVHGNNSNDGSGTGGLIGTNNEKGDITYSSLINEATGTVTGTNNVGGLIGVNKADITGGRDTVEDEDAGMYINKIYNNGVINVGAYIYNSKNGEYEFKVGTGSNIGGLIGDNQGSLTAGYNTGAINASGSTNVGGIAGSNSGKIEQVFNTVMVKPGSKQDAAIEGGTNVGGLVGNNSGILSNAYNTTSEVKGNAASTGNLVGINGGTVQYVYGVANNLIGSGTDAVNGYVIDTSDQWKQEGSYDGFTFGANGWKIYNGYSNPMLSVFLTKVTVVDQHLVNQYFSAKHYGELHQITADDIKALIAIGAISAPDGFGAFNNNNGLIQGVADDAMANSGNWLYSQQILGSNINGLFNPNNLGYDISLVYSPFENEDWPNNHWNYLFNDAPFDRNKDFRERKAEVNFVDGGMEI